MKLVPSGEYRKVYVPVLVDYDEGDITDGEEFDTTEDAEKFGIAMAKEYLEETASFCYIRIETRLITCYRMEKEE